MSAGIAIEIRSRRTASVRRRTVVSYTYRVGPHRVSSPRSSGHVRIKRGFPSPGGRRRSCLCMRPSLWRIRSIGATYDHEVEVQVKRLLHDLSCNQDAPVWSLSVGSESSQHATLESAPV